MSNGELTIRGRLVDQTSGDAATIPRPLFAGHSAVLTSDGSVVIVGGGATCFSMGTFWNKGVYSWRFPTNEGDGAEISQPPPRWAHEKTVEINPVQRSVPAAVKQQSTGEAPLITPIPRVKLETADDFVSIVRKGQPVVLEGLDLGSCVSAWTPEYLVDKVGADRKVRAPRPLSGAVMRLTRTGGHTRGGNASDGLYGQELPLRDDRVWRLCSQGGAGRQVVSAGTLSRQAV